MEVRGHVFLASALGIGYLSVSRPGRLTITIVVDLRTTRMFEQREKSKIFRDSSLDPSSFSLRPSHYVTKLTELSHSKAARRLCNRQLGLVTNIMILNEMVLLEMLRDCEHCSALFVCHK